MKAIKRLVLIVIFVPLLLVTAAVAFVLTLNPNTLKPILVEAAAKQHVVLQFSGDLSWQLYPRLGVTLGALEAANQQGQPLLKIGNAAVTVQLEPLLRREIKVSGLNLKDATAHYLIDAKGKTNWDALTSTATEEATPEQASATELPSINVEAINIQNLALSYSDAQTNTQADIKNLSLQVAQFGVTGTPFPVSLSLTANLTDLPPLKVQFSGPVGLHLKDQKINITDGQLNLSANNQTAEITIENTTQWGNALISKGNLNLKNIALRHWFKALDIELPATQNPNALAKLSAKTDYHYDGSALIAKNILLKLDQTTFKGNLHFSEFEAPKIVSHFTGDTINLDDYLSPENTTEAKLSSTTASAATPLPLEAIRPLTLNTSLKIQNITLKALPLSNTEVTIKAKKGLVNLDKIYTEVAGGQIETKGTVDARNTNAGAKINATLSTQDIEVGTLLKAFADTDKIAGKLFADATITSHGNTDQALMENLHIEAEAQSKALKIIPVNIEKAYCQAVALLQQKTLPAYDWPQLTQLEPVTVKIVMDGPQLNLSTLSAQIAKLTGNASGSFNMDKGTFNIPFTLSIGDFAGEIDGCLPIPEKWRKRTLPIRCKGSLEELGLKTCLPDTKLMGNLLKDKANQKIEAEKGRAEKKLKTKAQEFLDKNIKEEHKDLVEDKLKDLFKGLKK